MSGLWRITEEGVHPGERGGSKPFRVSDGRRVLRAFDSWFDADAWRRDPLVRARVEKNRAKERSVSR